MTVKLNPALDAKSLAVEYKKKNRLQIRNVFPPELAEKIYENLATKTPWGLFYFGENKGVRIRPPEFKTLTPEKQQEIYKYIFETAKTRYQYMYLYSPVSPKAPECPPLLTEILEFWNSETMLDFIRTLTGISELKSADAQATRYIGNCFLHPHSDEQEQTGRRVAYVLNMTRGWNPDWGGYLQFFDNNMNIVESLKPTFNALNLFTVPQGHSVGFVPPFCPGERLSITGWFRDK